ncbi:MAG: hypothetical protein M3Q69_00080 [Acidobacteriota bacterium]|nr:hypothetical protein [Acidobacteriota bacterium]
MNDLILRIFFSGLIAFIPSQDGKEMTVLLLNEPHAHHMTAAVPEHKAMMLVRAKSCEGACSQSDNEISTFLYPDAASPAAAAESLSKAVQKGAIWQLAGSELALDIPKSGLKLKRVSSADGKSVPDTVAERRDFRWVANLKDIDPSIGPLNPALFTADPPADLVVARLTLKSGEVSTHSMIRIGDDVAPLDFRSVAGSGPRYVRAAASWVQAEIRVPGNTLHVEEQSFGGEKKRALDLTPINGVIEMAVLNVTRPILPDRTAPPQPGLHFERYWDLAQRPPAAERRPVPQPPNESDARRNWRTLHADDKRSSALLNGIFFRDGRTTYDQILCPMSRYPQP